MLVKELAPRTCGVCQIALTTNTVETQTRGGQPVEFPCCIKCRSVIYDLEYEKNEMDAEDEIVKKARKHIDRGVDIMNDKTRHMQNAIGRQSYQFIPSFRSRKRIEGTTKKMQAASVESLFALARAKGVLV